MTYWQSPLLFCGLFNSFALSWLASDVFLEVERGPWERGCPECQDTKSTIDGACLQSHSRSCVPVKLKLKHPRLPGYTPGILTSFPDREGGNLMNLVFPGAGHLITTHGGWGI